MNVCIKYRVEDLYPDEKYEIVKKVDLIKDNYCPDLNVDYSMVNGCHNWVRVDGKVPTDIGMSLFEMFKSIDFNFIDDERFLPRVALSLIYSKDY